MSCRHRLLPLDRLLFKRMFKKLPGVGVGVSGDILRGAGDYDLTPADAAFLAQVDDPVGGLDDVEVVFDDDDGVAMIAQAVQHGQQLCDIVEMQAGGGFIQYIYSVLPVSRLESSRASLMRCASPPDSVVAFCPRVSLF